MENDEKMIAMGFTLGFITTVLIELSIIGIVSIVRWIF
jgi:hypothetical protein